MATIRNTILINTIKAEVAYRNTPHLRAFMPAAMRDKLTDLVARIRPNLQAAGSDKQVQENAAIVMTADLAVRECLQQLQAGIRYYYRHNDQVLAELAPLTLGKDDGENGLILRDTLHFLGGSEGARFPWPHELSREKAQDVAQAQDKARRALAAARTQYSTASAELRSLRPEATALWREGGLGAWISAMVPDVSQHAYWGKVAARKSKGRAAKVVEEPVSGGPVVDAPAPAQPLKEVITVLPAVESPVVSMVPPPAAVPMNGTPATGEVSTLVA